VGGVTVRFEAVAKRFANKVGLAAVSGRLDRGKVLVVGGANGAGKSTLLSIIAGLMRPSRGKVTYFSGDTELVRDDWFEQIGMAAPDMAVYEELSAIENLQFFARLRRRQLTETDLGALLEDLGLAARDHRRQVGGYSSGMKQRVKLAVAVLHEPPVLLLDEPSSNLDQAGHDRVAALVQRFRHTAAVVVASNDPREMAWGDERIELGR
jgi:heme exporter protein A